MLSFYAFSALTLLMRMVSVSAFVNLPLHHKTQKFSSGIDSPGWSRKKGRKTVVVLVVTYTDYVAHMSIYP